MIRLRPPSTGIRYTMSALASPVAGRSGKVLPIFTMRTRLSRCTGSPVNGDRSGPRGEGEGEGADLGAAARWPAGPPRVARTTPVTVSATAAAAPAAVSAMLRRSQTICCTPLGNCSPRPPFMIAGTTRDGNSSAHAGHRGPRLGAQPGPYPLGTEVVQLFQYRQGPPPDGLRHRLVPDRAVNIPEAGQYAALLGPVPDLLQQVQRAAVAGDGRGVVAQPAAGVAEMIQGMGLAEQVAKFPVQVEGPLAAGHRCRAGAEHGQVPAEVLQRVRLARPVPET